MSSDLKADVSSLHLMLLIGLIALCWLVCTVAQVEKYEALSRASLLCALGCTGVALLLLLLRRSYARNVDFPRWSLVATFCVLVLSFAVLYPKSQHHAPGKGSDREDALRVEVSAVLHHRYPYYARTFLHNPPTPLPGAMWLALPFFSVGCIALQNLLWAGIFFSFLKRFFARRATAVVFIVLFLLTALENLNDFDVGGDYITNIMYVSVAIFVFCSALNKSGSKAKMCLAVVFLGVALSSRILYVVILPPLLALAVQRTRPTRALLMISGVLLSWSLATFPVFLPHPFTNLMAQLNQNADKLRLLPQFFAGKTLPLLALLVASTSFWLRMNLQRVYLLAGVATLFLVLPPMLAIVHAQGGFARPLTADLEYLAVSAIFLALWAMSRWEHYLIPKKINQPALRDTPEGLPEGFSVLSATPV